MKFENTLSRWLLKKEFLRQFYIPFPPAKWESLALRVLEKICEKRWRAGDADGNVILKPIFIIGLPRSGTSMLYDLLCAHENAVFINHVMTKYFETPLAAEWVRKTFSLNVEGPRFLNDSVRLNIAGPAEPFTYWGRWFGRDVESLYWERKTKNDLGAEKIAQIYSDLKKIIFSYSKENPRFICKFATVQPEIELLQELFPDAKFVNIVRDGRAVAHSMLKLYKTSNDQLRKINHPLLKNIIPYPRIKGLEEYSRRYGADSIECTARVWRDSMQMLEDVKPKVKYYTTFRYEDLIADPRGTLEKLFAFCELSWPRSPLFQKEFKKIGAVKHVNRYNENEAVIRICEETLRAYDYL